MAPRLDDYVLRMRNLHKRYDLSKNVLELFRAYGEHHRGTKSPEELGRWLRTSPLLRRACTDTISSLAAAMQKNPTHECITECGEIITCCTEMLNLASKFGLDPCSLLLIPSTSPLSCETLDCLMWLY